MAEDTTRGKKCTPSLNDSELVFYDAVADHGTARELMDDEVLAPGQDRKSRRVGLYAGECHPAL
nr:DUF3387 domain-containing protein [Streptomyces chartreusis]